MKVYLVRHGESEANAKKLHCGHGQFPLTEKGEKEAENVGKLLRGIKFDKVYSSDLVRANTTGKIALPEYEIEQLSLIREISVGSIAGKNRDELEKELGEPLIRNKKNLDFRDYGGENIEMLFERAKKFLERLSSESYETVAVFSHEVFIKAMVSEVLGVRIELSTLICKNCSVAILSYEKDKWQLLSWNSGEN